MTTPRVSICLPNLNNRVYLKERIDTIYAQTFKDWELIVCDNFSDDGAWSYFQELASMDCRVIISQKERKGMYDNWNNCIRQARGEFIYVATSDDTMAPDFLEKMVCALDENPDCGLAHCPMKVIDQCGNPGRDWWSSSSLFARSSPDLINMRHKRIAPYDGILCLLGDNIYSSVTQLLIKRALYDKTGHYRVDWGSLGDFHWNLRASLAVSTVHVPDTWGGWRMHSAQATASVILNSTDHQNKIDEMIDDVLINIDKYLISSCSENKLLELKLQALDVRNHLREHNRHSRSMARHIFLVCRALQGSRPARKHLISLFSETKRWPIGAPSCVRSWFQEPVLLPL